VARDSGSPAVELDVGHRTVRITNPERVYFPARGETKVDLARYYLSVGDGIVRALREIISTCGSNRAGASPRCAARPEPLLEWADRDAH
jgi:hypothetical protein